MEAKSKKAVYLIMFIAFAIVILGVGTYAYLTNSQGVGEVLNANTETAKESTFTSYHDGELTFNISASQMAQLEVSTDPIATDNAAMTVELSGSSDYESTICTYDVVWVWDSDTNNRYVQSDVSLPYVSSSGIKYPYEFSVQLNSGTEIDLSELDWSDDGTTAVLLSQQRISSDSNIDKTIQNYEVTIRMYNIGAAQKNLFDKDFKAHIEMQNYDCVTETITNGTMHYYVKQDDGSYSEVETIATSASGLNFHYDGTLNVNDNLSYCKRNGAYTYNEVDNTFSATVEDDECYIYIDELNTFPVLATSITNSAGLTTGAGQVVEENGFRYQGDNPNNFVCFGSDAATCPADNLFRIVGAFNDTGTYLAKIQKNTIYNNTNYILHPTYEGTLVNSYWPNTQLYPTMNTTYYGSFASEYQNMIANVNWKLGGVQFLYESLTAPQFYTQERGATANAGVGYQATFRIGLIYPSDYGYAVLESDCARTIALNAYKGTSNCYNLNWMYDASNNQWMISPQIRTDSISAGFIADTYGIINAASVNFAYAAIRPTFYLDSDVKVTGGTGTSADPYRISL